METTSLSTQYTREKHFSRLTSHFTRLRGFTLMELLIVIAVIGILISVSAVAYSSAQKKTRDIRRKSDLKAIQNALEQYYADNNARYPASASCAQLVATTTYLPDGMPRDPKTAAAYTSTADWRNCTTSTYCVCAALEGETNTKNDCTGDQDSLPAGYTGFYCIGNVQ